MLLNYFFLDAIILAFPFYFNPTAQKIAPYLSTRRESLRNGYGVAAQQAGSAL